MLTVYIWYKNTPFLGMDWSQYRSPGTFYVSLVFGVVWFAKVCFLLPIQFSKSVDFTLALSPRLNKSPAS